MLRAFAVLLVLGRHVQFPLVGFHPTIETVLAVWMQGGWTGVDLFFVLSGFLVSGLLFREYGERGSISVGRFLVRRGLKIYPAFYAFLAITIAIGVVHWDITTLSAPGLVGELFFVQNYLGGLWWHTWSLAVEEHFYLFCAVLLFILTARGRSALRAIPYLSAVIALGCLVGRVLTAALVPYADRTHVFATHLRIDGLMFGVLLSYLWHFHRATVEGVVRGREVFLWVIGIALLVPAFLYDMRTAPFIYTYGFSLFYLGSGCLVLAVAVRGVPDIAPVRVLASIGAFSYSIYLWHLWVLFEVQRVFAEYLAPHPNSPAGVVTYMLGSVALGIAMSKIVEVPVLALRDRIFPSRSSRFATIGPGALDRPVTQTLPTIPDGAN